MGFILLARESRKRRMKLLGNNLSGGLLEGLANLELHHRAGRNGYILTGVLGVTANLGLNLLNGEGAKVAEDDTVAIAQSVGNQVDGLLDYFKYIILREVAVELLADLINKLAFCNCVSHIY